MRRMSLDTTTVDSTRPTQRDPNVTPTEGAEGLSPAKVLCYLAPRLGHRQSTVLPSARHQTHGHVTARDHTSPVSVKVGSLNSAVRTRSGRSGPAPRRERSQLWALNNDAAFEAERASRRASATAAERVLA